ncbi:DUF2273 domain-containing protein [Lactobacillus sp. LC28-10]|uniref:DUF2273 domain-containing protein n=1 Tax=Secundilactobacillus angelensis TaxID=2722706 RepID=A0ABX1KVJ7_9LACO|nr:DUF2273 domain-containing protein [Secundilactobacillus angelensis]NLR17926.1 DUF2273 domain-containing protein [Secundilactobacillus angelensis]
MPELLKYYRWPIIGGVTGLVLALLLLTIGFWKTLILFILVGLGIAAGLYLSQTGLLDDYFK